ncbi:MAG: 4Fe-4S binding protein [Thermodesulfobacteriota bacterium]
MIQFRIAETRCTGCGECAQDCPASIIDMDAGIPRITDESGCFQCRFRLTGQGDEFPKI